MKTAKLKVLISPLLVVQEVWYVKPTCRKSWAGNLLMWSVFTLSPSFKVKQVELKLRMFITHLFLVLEVCNVKPNCRKSWMWSDLTLGPSFKVKQRKPWWQSGNTLASHLWGSLQYRTLVNCMYWFPGPFQLPVVIWPVQCWKWRKTPNK